MDVKWFLKRYHAVIMLIFLTGIIVMSPFSRTFASNLCVEYYSRNTALPNTNELNESLYAVHITEYLPEGGTIRTVIEGRARLASTLHFSLGAPVNSHESGNWSKHKFAILLPLKYLNKQLLNISAQDTFIFGDLVLPKDSFLLVPSDRSAPIDFPGKIIFYDFKIGVRTAVETTLKDLGSITLESKGSLVHDPVSFRGVRINESVFFESFLKRPRLVTNLDHVQTIFGKIDKRIYDLFKDWFYSNSALYEKYEHVRYQRLLLSKLLDAVTSEVLQMDLSKENAANLEKSVLHAKTFINLLDVEIWAQETHQKSLFKKSNVLKNKMLEAMDSPIKLRTLVEHELQILPSLPVPTHPSDTFSMIALEDFSFLSYTQFKALAEKQIPISTASEKFELEYLILSKAIIDYQARALTIAEAVSSFERVIAVLPDWGYARIISVLQKIPTNSERRLFVASLATREALMSSAYKKSFEDLLN